MSKYTAEQVRACILAYKNVDLNYCRSGIVDLLTEYASILDAEGDDGAVAYFSANPAEGEFSTHKSLAEAIAGAESLLAFAQDVASDEGWADDPPQICYGVVLGGCVEKEGSRRPAPEGSDFTEMVDFRLTAHPHPARSGVVRDADVDAVIKSVERVNTDGMDGDSWDRILVRAALEHFAKGAEVGGDAQDAARYRWLREHFRFANDSLREIWFDAYTRVSQDDAKDLDKAIDAAVQEQSHE